MSKKIKLSKLAIVAFLTVLIWVWADRALEVTRSIPTATIVVGRTRPDLWVSFSSGPVIAVNRINLSGPASVINDLESMINNDPKKLEFTFLPEQFGINETGEYPINVQDIIKQSSWIEKSGLIVGECDPSKITVNAVVLTKRDLDVQCLDEDELQINLEFPVTVSMYVPTDWRKPAQVKLSDEEIARAILQPISKKPFIKLSNLERREADSYVEIKLPPQENQLEKFSINNATLGYTMSEGLNGHYNITIDDAILRDIVSIEVLATPEAKAAYEAQHYQVILEILEGDDQMTRENGEVRRDVYFKLPEEYVRTNQITLVRKKVEARFKVTPIEADENSP